MKPRLRPLFFLALAGPALAGTPGVRTLIIPGFDEAHTPSEWDAIPVHRYAASVDVARSPLAVLVLVPDQRRGAAWYDRLARRLVEKGGVEVWIAERRERLLEERAVLEAADRDPRLLDAARDYYLGRAQAAGSASRAAGWKPLDGKSFPALKATGLEALYGDIHRAVNSANRMTAAPLVLGGAGSGAAFVTGYAATEFDGGRVGSDGLAGLLLVDPQLACGDAEAEASRKRDRDAAAAALNSEDVLEGSPLAAVQYEIALRLASTDPRARSPFADALVPPSVRRSGLTNEAFAGWLLDLGKDRGDLAIARIGEFDEPSGPGLRGWKRHTVVREKTALSDILGSTTAPGGLVAWYRPRALTLDLAGLEVDHFQDARLRCRGLSRITTPVFCVCGAPDADAKARPSPPLGVRWTLDHFGTKAIVCESAAGFALGDLLFSVESGAWIDRLHSWLLDRTKPEPK